MISFQESCLTCDLWGLPSQKTGAVINLCASKSSGGDAGQFMLKHRYISIPVCLHHHPLSLTTINNTTMPLEWRLNRWTCRLCPPTQWDSVHNEIQTAFYWYSQRISFISTWKRSDQRKSGINPTIVSIGQRCNYQWCSDSKFGEQDLLEQKSNWMPKLSGSFGRRNTYYCHCCHCCHRHLQM